MNPHDFVNKWKQSVLKERSAYQSHFIDLCSLINHLSPSDLDPTGSFFTFEAFATKDSGGNGFADVWYKGRFAWEYKGKHANLQEAYQQLLQYREALQNPPLLIVCDIDTIQIHTNFTNTVKRIIPLTLDNLLTPAGLDILNKVFNSPDSLRSAQTPDQVTQDAARQFAHLADLLRKYGTDPNQAAHFLIQLLFCLFAEDAGLLPVHLLSAMIEQTRTRPTAFTAQLSQLFQVMATGGWFGPVEIPYFDGRLFEISQVPSMDSESMDILHRVCSLDWSQIQPSIFGTLFERSLDPSKRTQLGAHYTSQSDILLIVEPVLMAPLRRRWAEIQTQARDLAKQRDQVKGSKRQRLQEKIEQTLMGFSGEIASTQVLDPACGSGNFLYVALRQLLDLEKEVITLLAELGGTRFFPSVNPTQLHGIEINEYAHQLAQATIWIGYIQWLRENGFGYFAQPILKPLDNILHMDAILAHDSEGKPVEPEWPKADVIIGNPPFLGGNKIRAGLGDKNVDDLFELYKDRVPAFADLVCYWFEKARRMIELGEAKRVGLLATNSIRGGANRKIIERIKKTGNIFWAQSDRDWILDGAAVNVSMVGFDSGYESQKLLDNRSVVEINSDLSSVSDLTVAVRLSENRDICFMGPSAKGPFDIDAELASTMISTTGNPNGKPNSDVVKRVASAVDLVQESRNKWTIDFASMDQPDAALYEVPFEYLRKTVYPVRSKNRRASYSLKWWQYAEARPGMRRALDGKTRFISTPGVSKHRIFVWMPKNVLCNQGTLVFAVDDDYYFGVLQSRPHELWSLKLGTSLEDRPRYTPTTTFETYPFPWPPGQEPWSDSRLQAIASAAKELVELRDAWLNPPGLAEAELKKRTLTNLYNQRPTWLDLAHRKLDRAVFTAYGWPADLTDEQILERLLALNHQRAGVS